MYIYVYVDQRKSPAKGQTEHQKGQERRFKLLWTWLLLLLLMISLDSHNVSDDGERSSKENSLLQWNMACWYQILGCWDTIEEHQSHTLVPAKPLQGDWTHITSHLQAGYCPTLWGDSKLLGEFQSPASKVLAEPAKDTSGVCAWTCVWPEKHNLKIFLDSDSNQLVADWYQEKLHSLYWEIIVS